MYMPDYPKEDSLAFLF